MRNLKEELNNLEEVEELMQNMDILKKKLHKSYINHSESFFGHAIKYVENSGGNRLDVLVDLVNLYEKNKTGVDKKFDIKRYDD